MKKTLLYLLCILPNLMLAQYTIEATFTPANNYRYALLYKVTPSGTQYITDVRPTNGTLTITLDEQAMPGIYRLVYGIPQEENNIEIIYNGKEHIQFTFSEEEGTNYIASEENILWQNYTKEFHQIQNQIAQSVNKENSNALFNDAVHKLSMLHKNYEKAAEGMLVHNFISNYKFYIPDGSENIETYQKKLLDTYLDNIDYTNKILQGTRFLHDLTYGYILIHKNHTSAITNVVNKMEPTTINFKKAFLYDLWVSLTALPEIEKANYLAKNYLIPLAEEAGDTQMVATVTTFTNLTIGSKAPNFSWKENNKTKTLHNLAFAEQYILVFWSSSCSHCLAEVPKIYGAIENIDAKKLKVIAIGLEEEPYEWKNVTQNFPKFINVLGLGKWDNEIGNLYAIEATPTYYVLDKDKNIKAKPQTLEELLIFIEAP